MKLVLYGAGKRCKPLCKLLKNLQIEKQEVIIIDANKDKCGILIEGYLVSSLDTLLGLNDALFCITLADQKEVKRIRDHIKNRVGDKVHEVAYNVFIVEAFKISKLVKQHVMNKKICYNASPNYLFDCYSGGLCLGGIESWTKDICQALIESGNTRTYIVSKNGDYIVPHLLESRILYVDRNDDSWLFENIMSLINLIIEKLPCKIITSQVSNVLFAAGVVKHYFPDLIEVISVIHGGHKQIYSSYLETSKYTDAYVGVSQDIRNEMIERGISPSRIYAMTCPFPCEKDLERKYTVGDNEAICIGYAGRMDGFEHSQKRMDVLLKLIKELDARNINFSVKLAGDGPARSQMECYIHENALESRVVFLGTIDRKEIPNFWRRQDICVNAADYEGRSISIIEAMGNGAVPIVTMVSGTKEDIIDDENGYLIPLEDYKAMADKIEYLARNRDRLPTMGKKAHDIVYPKSLMSEHLKFWNTIL